MIDSALREQRDASLALLARLIRRGRELRQGSSQRSEDSPSQARPADSAPSASLATEADLRIWQNDCAAAITELSGGSKAHWLSRAFSSALLVRASGGAALVEASATEIVTRILDVLRQAEESLATLDTGAIAAAAAQPPVRQFEFVHDAALRPVLEEAFAASRRLFEAGEYEPALKTTCGILEAIITDALQHDGRLTASGDALSPDPQPHRQNVAAPAPAAPDLRSDPPQLEWTFDRRIIVAEQAGLIRGGCARLTTAARAYRDAAAGCIASERDARIAAQVLRVVMRDLDPGR